MLWHGAAWHAKRKGGIYACLYTLRVLTPHSDSIFLHAYVTSHIQYTTYKIVAMCIECATTFRAIDKLMSGSSLEGKTFLRSHQL